MTEWIQLRTRRRDAVGAARAREIKEVAAAVQRQIARDFAPIWGLEATIDPFLKLEGRAIGLLANNGPRRPSRG